jgi:lysophospholipase L1-like esterase
MRKTLLMSALTLALAACGGGGGGTSTTPQQTSTNTTPAAPAQTCAGLLQSGAALTPKCHITIAWVGDSTYWGVDVDNTSNEVQAPGVGNGVVGRASPTPVQILQAYFDATYGAGVVGIIDLSIPGATTPSFLNGTAPNATPLGAELAALPIHADIVTDGLQINDQYVLNDSTATYVANQQAFISTVVSYGAIPVYLEPNPIAASSGYYASYAAQIGQTNNMVYNAELAYQNAGYPSVGSLYEWENYTTPPNAQPWNIIWMSSDNVHPNQAGYQQKINNYFNGVPNVLGVTSSLNQIIADKLAGLQS